MSTTFRLNADELEPSFLEKLKAMFAHQRIRISVTAEEPATASMNGTASPRGVRGKDLLGVIDSLAHLSKEETEAFAKDLREIRRLGNAPLPPDPWAS
ncbi:MAG TPA: hypothetical protein VFH95_12580 [Candidatus Kapabacteria bacterium]|nr:hypothetical protein [Candidatus Kapabacteria bacterium]